MATFPLSSIAHPRRGGGPHSPPLPQALHPAKWEALPLCADSFALRDLIDENGRMVFDSSIPVFSRTSCDPPGHRAEL